MRMMDDDMKRLFISSSMIIIASKGLAIGSPLCLKYVVDLMSTAQTFNLTHVWLGIGAFATSRALATALQEYRMFKVAQLI